MARKTVDITIDAKGRDYGRVYRLTEMSARQAEDWALRAFMGMARSGVQVPDDITSMGIMGIAMLGFRAFAGMNPVDAKPLLDEMFSCVQYVPDPQKPKVARPLIDDDTDEVSTRFRLRKEVFELHTGFFERAARLKSATAVEPASSDTPNT